MNKECVKICKEWILDFKDQKCDEEVLFWSNIEMIFMGGKNRIFCAEAFILDAMNYCEQNIRISPLKEIREESKILLNGLKNIYGV